MKYQLPCIAVAALSLLATPALAQDNATLLDSAFVIPAAEFTVEKDKFLSWLDANMATLPGEQVMSVKEHLYLLIGTALQAQYRATSNVFPKKDTLGLADLFEYGNKLGLYGAGLVARTISTPGRALSTPVPSTAKLKLELQPPNYVLAGDRGWTLRFPYYFMVGALETQVLNDGIESDIVILSTLFAKHRDRPGQSQATVMIVSAQPKDTAAFFNAWVQHVGMDSADRVVGHPGDKSARYRAFNQSAGMRIEAATFTHGSTALFITYVGLPGTFESNREDFEGLLRTIQFSRPASRKP